MLLALCLSYVGEKKKAAQEADFKAVYAGLHEDIPLVCVCGNHDIGNTPTHDSITNYQRSFGDDYFSFWVGGVMFLVLNSQFFEDDSQVMPTLKASISSFFYLSILTLIYNKNLCIHIWKIREI